MNNLEFRRQYLLSNVPVEKIDGWKHYEIPNKSQSYNLYYHPELEITTEQSQDKNIVLLGYILDPYHPELSNAEIISRLVKLNNLQEVFKETANLSGRFTIIYNNGKDAFIFHDATGFREIYYSFGNNKAFCGSTPDIINKYVNAEKDNDASIIEFLKSPEYVQQTKWMGTRTLFKGIYHLLPNNYIDLNAQTYHRY